MSETEKLRIGDPMPRIESVSALGSYRIEVKWKDGLRRGTTSSVDLAPLICTFKVYAPLRDDPALFGTIHAVEGGSAIAWGPNELIDMAAASVEDLADEEMSSADFAVFLKKHALSLDAAAAQLGISRRLVAYYAKNRPIPRYIALACNYLDQRGSSVEHSLDATYVPRFGPR